MHVCVQLGLLGRHLYPYPNPGLFFFFPPAEFSRNALESKQVCFCRACGLRGDHSTRPCQHENSRKVYSNGCEGVPIKLYLIEQAEGRLRPTACGRPSPAPAADDLAAVAEFKTRRVLRAAHVPHARAVPSLRRGAWRAESPSLLVELFLFSPAHIVAPSNVPYEESRFDARELRIRRVAFLRQTTA